MECCGREFDYSRPARQKLDVKILSSQLAYESKADVCLLLLLLLL